jgi:hypothetical protein
VPAEAAEATTAMSSQQPSVAVCPHGGVVKHLAALHLSHVPVCYMCRSQAHQTRP